MYVVRTKSARYSEDVEGDVMDGAIQVIVSDEESVDTGLLDHHGNPIWRVADPKIWGFR